MFTDLVITFNDQTIRTCCKSTAFDLSNEEITSDIFLKNKDYENRKKEMLFNNKLPEDACRLCIRTEPNSFFRFRNSFSERTFTVKEKKELLNNSEIKSFELMLENTCQLKCLYCNENFSTEWAKEKGLPIHNDSKEWTEKILENFFIMLSNLENQKTYQFVLTGGEPLINYRTYDIIEKIINTIDKNNVIIFNIVTNLGIKSSVLSKYADLIEKYPNVKWKYNCSIDGIHREAEAIRTGLSWNQFMKNFNILLDTSAMVRISPALNLYSITSLPEFFNIFNNLLNETKKMHKDAYSLNIIATSGLSLRNAPKEFVVPYLQRAIEVNKNEPHIYNKLLYNEIELAGSGINKIATYKVNYWWNYYKTNRPEYDWDNLFPHIPQIIEKLNEYRYE